MKKLYFILPFLAASVLTACSSTEPTEEEPVICPVVDYKPIISPDNPNWTLSSSLELTETEKGVVKEFNQFSYDLMRKVSDKNSGDYCCSPVSVSIYMSMIANAAGGESRGQILSALHVDDLATVNSLNTKLMHFLPCEDNGVALSINNRFWVADRHTVNPDFISTIRDVFNGAVDYVDFSKPTTVPAINKWIYDKTKGLIPSILDGDWYYYVGLDMASANTVYFKGLWDNTFERSNTKKELFYGTESNKSIDMMHQNVEMQYASNDKFKLVVKNFYGKKNRAEFYLPAKELSPAEFTAILTPEMQEQLYMASTCYEVNLSLPKYQSYREAGISDVISGMGINLECMDLSSMGLPSSSMGILHKTSLKFYEEGAELAAVTGGMLGTAMPPERPKNVTVQFNRPFIYIIRNTQTGMILMAGTVCNVK